MGASTSVLLKLSTAAAVVFAVVAGLYVALGGTSDPQPAVAEAPSSSAAATPAASVTEAPAFAADSWMLLDPDGDFLGVDVPAPVDLAFADPYPGSTVGLITFRGSPTRSYHGSGPIPASAAVDWSYPQSGAMCGSSTVGSQTTQWCGAGWTGQASVLERSDGSTWLIFGAYDKAVHFVDADTGLDVLPPFPTGDIIKGSVTIDPDGFPIVYSGSRDGKYRAIAFDGDAPRELWALTAADATGPTRWNDDWDGSGLIIDDHLLIGGENSRMFVAKLNRGYDDSGAVTVAPEVLWDAPGWDDELTAAVGSNVSIENSVAFNDGVVYFANSGGLVQGWDLAPLLAGEMQPGEDGEAPAPVEPERVLRFWTGDDTDASIVIDDEGMLYVASEWERFNSRSSEVGQIMKLDPSRPDDPLVWGFVDPRAASGRIAGVWGTPALHRDTVIVPTTGGTLFALSRADGSVVWEMELGDHLWSSPVVIGDVLIQGDCQGGLHAFDLDPDGLAAPVNRWTVELPGCLESTPAVWDGRIYVATRAGQMWAVAGLD